MKQYIYLLGCVGFSFALLAQDTPLPESPAVKANRELIKNDPYHTGALWALADWTLNGAQGIKRDVPQALAYLKRGVELGGGYSFYQKLVIVYGQGDGVDVDHKKAIHWATKGAERGHKVLLWFCASYIQIGKPGWPRDYELAVELAEMSAAQPSELGPFYRVLAGNYSTGIEGELKQDGKKAIELYLKSSKHSELALAYSYIAEIHGAGVGVEQDKKKYVEWLLKSVKFSRTKDEKGNYSERVGYAYGDGGIGFEKDLVENWAWLRFALENGKVGNNNHNLTYTDHLLKEVLTPQQIASAKKRLLELKAGKY